MQQKFWPVHESAYRQKKSYFVHKMAYILYAKKFLWKTFWLFSVTQMHVRLALNKIMIVRLHEKHSLLFFKNNKNKF